MREDIKERMEIIRRGEVPKGYQRTRIGVNPNEWYVMSLKELIVDGKIFNGIF